jgi:hypothetical protein
MEDVCVPALCVQASGGASVSARRRGGRASEKEKEKKKN